mgnify:CR=1 FL=1
MSRLAPLKWLTTLAATLMLLFLTLPIFALILRAIQTQAWGEAPGSGIPDAIWLSFITTTATVLLTLSFGTPLAYVLVRRRFPFKGLISTLVELPIVLPPAVAGLALLIAFGRRGLFGAGLSAIGISLPFTTFAVVMAQTFVAAPFFIRAAQVGFAGVPRELEDAARVDGASEAGLFLKITLPLTSRALGAGIALSWARALGEFGATILFAGSLQGRTQTMPLLIYNVIERDINAAIWTGLILIGLALVALIAAHFLGKRSENDLPL